MITNIERNSIIHKHEIQKKIKLVTKLSKEYMNVDKEKYAYLMHLKTRYYAKLESINFILSCEKPTHNWDAERIEVLDLPKEVLLDWEV